MKCEAKVEIKNPKAITMKNGRPATQGECPSCETKVFRIGIPSNNPRHDRSPVPKSRSDH